MASYEKISEMFDANPYILRILVNSEDLSQARRDLFDYLNRCEKEIYDEGCPLHPLEKKNTIDCIRVFKNIIAPVNEKKAKHSCLETLWGLATEHWRQKDWSHISDALLMDLKALFKGVIGLSGIYSKSGICKREVPAFVHLTGRESAILRSDLLNEKVDQYRYFIRKNGYRTGLDPKAVKARVRNKRRILEVLGGSENEWCDYRWHLKNVFRTSDEINRVMNLTEEEELCIKRVNENNLPFSITPFYLSLMDKEPSSCDKSLRDHVIPNQLYLEKMLDSERDSTESMDFMNEMGTSPVDLVTRRYPMIAIFKPTNSCSQICVYCQRNWEIVDVNTKRAQAPSKKMTKAFSWFRNNTGIEEVLITGGDPLVMSNEKIEKLLKSFFEIPHIKRIRIGTRFPITVPMRFNNALLSILNKYHNPPKKTVTIVTHVQNSYEISTESANIVKRIRSLGIDVFNQQVFTIQNCRKFETCFLRDNLKAIGITPYYLFNLKGKHETDYFRVPIARLLQENKEEARLMPGTLRTDKPVFNLPTLGKNDLLAWQDHDVVMILDDGSRIYEFFPWEKYMAPVNTFLYKDEPIYNFLRRLEQLGEDPDDYKTIWYYF